MKKFRHGPEELEMIKFFDYARAVSNTNPAWNLAYHVPNERKASIQRRITMARAGVKAGIPDICIPVANEKYTALYIEMKVKPNKPSPVQTDVIRALNSVGNYACICWSADEAIEIATKYLADKL